MPSKSDKMASVKSFYTSKPGTAVSRNTAAKKAVRAANTKTFNTKVNKALKSMSLIERRQKTVTLSTQITKGSGLITTDQTSPVTTHGICYQNLFNTMLLNRGDEQGEFNGNKISDVKLNISGVAISQPYNSSTNSSVMPFEVWFVFYKNRDGVQANGKPNDMKQYPNNQVGDIHDIFTTTYPWNKDQFIIKGVKRFKLRANPQDTDQNNVYLNSVTSNAPIFRRFNYQVPVAKVLKYGDGENIPTNDYISLGIYVMNGDGENLPPAQARCKIMGSMTMSYTDA